MEILTAEDKKAIDEALANAKKLREEISKAKRAGLDVADLEKRLDTAEERLKSIRRVYFT